MALGERKEIGDSLRLGALPNRLGSEKQAGNHSNRTEHHEPIFGKPPSHNTASNGAASALSAKIDFGGIELTSFHDVPADTETGYNAVYDLMSEALEILRDGINKPRKLHGGVLERARKHILAPFETEVRTDVDEDALLGFMNGIFGTDRDFKAEQKSIDAVIKEISSIQAHMFDALLLVDRANKVARQHVMEWRGSQVTSE